MRLEFINASPVAARKDVAIQRRIRAQAMRHFREKQRLQWAHSELNNGTISRRRAKNSISTQENEDLVQFVQHLSSLPLTISTVGSEAVDPFREPSYVAQLFGVCSTWFRWLRPGVQKHSAVELATRAWEVAPSPMLLCAASLAAIGCLDSMDESRPHVNDALFKARVLQEVNERMGSIETATADSTISALLLLTSFELCRVSPQARMHLQGLKGIVSLRRSQHLGSEGRVDSDTGTTELTVMLEGLDLMQTVLFDLQPVLTSLESSRTTKSARSKSKAVLPDSVLATILSDLSQLSDRPETLSQASFTTDVAYLLARAFSCVSAVLQTSELHDESVDSFFETLMDFDRKYCRADESVVNTPTKFARAMHQTLAILYNLVCNQNPYGHISHESYADGLLTTLQVVSDNTWRKVPNIKLWMVMVATAATRDVHQKSLLKCFLGRMIYLKGIYRFQETKSFILNWLKMQRTLKWWAEQTSDEEVDSDLYTDTPTSSINLSAMRADAKSHFGGTSRLQSTSQMRASAPSIAERTRPSTSETSTSATRTTSDATLPSNPRIKRKTAEIFLEDRLFQAAVCTGVTDFESGTTSTSLSLPRDTTASLTLWMPYEFTAPATTRRDI